MISVSGSKKRSLIFIIYENIYQVTDQEITNISQAMIPKILLGKFTSRALHTMTSPVRPQMGPPAQGPLHLTVAPNAGQWLQH